MSNLDLILFIILLFHNLLDYKLVNKLKEYEIFTNSKGLD